MLPRRAEEKPVSTPREVMNALRGRPADSQLGVEYLRDRRAGNVRITIPKAMPLRIPLPAVPPAPPAPPAPPVAPKPAAAPSAGSLPSARITQRMSIAAGRAL